MEKTYPFILDENMVYGDCIVSNEIVQFSYKINKNSLFEVEFNTNSSFLNTMSSFISFYKNLKYVLFSVEDIGSGNVKIKMNSSFFDSYKNILEEWIIKQSTKKTDTMAIL